MTETAVIQEHERTNGRIPEKHNATMESVQSRIPWIARQAVRDASDAKQGRKRKGSDRVTALVSFSRAPTLTQVSASRDQPDQESQLGRNAVCPEQTGATTRGQ